MYGCLFALNKLDVYLYQKYDLLNQTKLLWDIREIHVEVINNLSVEDFQGHKTPSEQLFSPNESALYS